MQSAWERYLRWCLTKNGKRSCCYGFVALNIGTFSLMYFPQTFFLHKYQNFAQLYQHGKPFEVPGDLKSLYEEVLDDLKVHELERKVMKPFMTFGFNMFQAGMSGTKTGGIIGMPANLAFTSSKQIEPNKILINNIPVDLSRKESDDLIQSLILSRDAKKFAIAREVLTYLESSKVLDCIIGSAIFIMSYTVCQWLKEKYDMYKKPLRSRVLVYAAVGFGGIGLYYTQKDFMIKRTEEKVDKKLVQLSPGYVKGGQEFYSKALVRNIAHRSLLDKHGDELFDEKGNPVFYFRQKTTPLSERKTVFDSKIEQYMEEQTNLLNPELSEITP